MLSPVVNRAAQLGPQRFAWWPQWQGETVAVVACGASLSGMDLKPLRGRVKVIAIKEAFVRLCPFADVAYGCDLPWWAHRRGLPDFKGLKIGFDGGIADRFPGVRLITIRPIARAGGKKYVKELLLEEPGEIGGGGNSGFQALNLAVQFGARRVLLLGFDMLISGPVHFYGRNVWPKARNPDEVFLRNCVEHFEQAASLLSSIGVDVINASPISAIRSFRKASIQQALSEWGA